MCGIVGIGPHPRAKQLAYEALLALKHRGEDGAGIAVYNLESNHPEIHTIEIRKQTKPIDTGNILEQLKELPDYGFAIGSTRFPTVGPATDRNTQPLCSDGTRGRICLATNGEIFTEPFKNFIAENHVERRTQSDTELMLLWLLHVIQKNSKPIHEFIAASMRQMFGAYCTLFMMDHHPILYGFRDPYGIRPMELGQLDSTYVIVSETCALEAIKAKHIRSINPGEIVMITADNELKSVQAVPAQGCRFCVMELIYFMRPDSLINGETIDTIRERLGRECAKEYPAPEADFVSGLPKSGEPAAVGYYLESQKPYGRCIIKNPVENEKRTYISSTKKMREEIAERKYKLITDRIKGKNIAVIDDTIIKGFTAPLITRKLKDNGAASVHFRVTCPPHRYGCPYGMGYKREEAIAQQKSVEQIQKEIGCDSLGYLSLEGLYKAIGRERCQFCDGCLTGEYPVLPPAT